MVKGSSMEKEWRERMARVRVMANGRRNRRAGKKTARCVRFADNEITSIQLFPSVDAERAPPLDDHNDAISRPCLRPTRFASFSPLSTATASTDDDEAYQAPILASFIAPRRLAILIPVSPTMSPWVQLRFRCTMGASKGSFVRLSDARNQFCDGESASLARDSNMTMVEGHLVLVVDLYLELLDGLAVLDGKESESKNRLSKNGNSISLIRASHKAVIDATNCVQEESTLSMNSLKECLSELRPCHGKKQELSHEGNLDGNDFIAQISVNILVALQIVKDFSCATKQLLSPSIDKLNLRVMSMLEDTLVQLQNVSLCYAFCSERHCQKTANSLNVVGHKSDLQSDICSMEFAFKYEFSESKYPYFRDSNSKITFLLPSKVKNL
ncbi:hypothetical protein PIB30_049884 [Stylosanthes scabra]|uniref:Uncharacterized protein n=1 Tax=Stylosanthes scabra TaxID=79078 RepID=A0ABU6WFQ0_9FABA|nr:hypothetical protein [Stylosanthes scabra]